MRESVVAGQRLHCQTPNGLGLYEIPSSYTPPPTHRYCSYGHQHIRDRAKVWARNTLGKQEVCLISEALRLLTGVDCPREDIHEHIRDFW